jgi:hypothetical protein
MNKRYALVAGAVAVLALGVTRSQAQPEDRLAKLETRIAKLEERIAKLEAGTAGRESERRDLLASPDRFIGALDVQIFDRGIVNNYSKATEVKLENKSHFNVTGLSGVVEYRTADGKLVGSAPIELEGTLLAGQTATLKATSNEVTGKSDPAQSKVIIKQVTILE